MPAGGRSQSRRRRAFHGLEREPFDHDRAEPVEIGQVSELDAVSEGAARGDNRIGEMQCADFYGEIDCFRRVHGGLV